MNNIHTHLTWWKKAIGYIIYPSTFKDGNNDGIGDLQGIISKLDYLKNLGVDLLWICPFFKSPLDDNGYDVSDYLQVDPRFGTNEEFDLLIKEAHTRGIRIVIDFVLNHTSDEHPWFVEARNNPVSPKRD
ncbi:MAG: alpha-amylase family glycosyl hydrolase, partial [Bacilli bacterium]